MPLRAIAIIFSLVLHAFVGNAFWLQLQRQQPEAFDLGEGQEIFLEPRGLDVSEVTSIGDDLQTIETQAAIPIDQRTPPPPSVVPVERPDEIDPDPAGETLEDVVDVAPPETPPQDPTRTAPEQIRDVIASEQSTVEQELVDAREPAPDLIEEQNTIAAHRTTAPDDIAEPDVAVTPDVPPEPPLDQPELAAADQPIRPDEIKQPEPLEFAHRAQPDRLPEPELDSAVEPTSPIVPLDDPTPDVIEVVAQPDQVVIVTEHSAGEEKKGGDATVTRIYLGKINGQVQRAKVNPRSRQTGTVVVKFTIGTDGALMSREVVSSSGADVLDGAAIATLDRAAPFPPIPPEVSAEPMTFTQAFRYLLR